MILQTGLNGGIGASFPGVAGTNAGASPQAATAAQAGFGVSMGGQDSSGGDTKTTGVLSVGTLSLLALIFIWWSLPR